MNPRINYTLVGAFVVLLLLAGIAMLALMTQDDRQTQRQTYITYFSESVAGLNERASVRFLGVPVGVVEHIALDSEREGRVRLELRIDPGVPIRQGSIASLQNQGITGLLYVEIGSGDINSPLLETSDKNPAVIQSQASRLLQITEALNETLNRFNQLSDNLTQLTHHLSQLSDEHMREQLSGAMSAFINLSQTAEQQLGQLDIQAWDELARSMTRLSESLAQQSDSFPDELESFRKLFADTLGETNRQLSAMSRDGQVLARELVPVLRDARALTETLVRDGDILIRGPRQIPAGPGEQK